MSNKPKFIIPDSATFAAIAQRAANSAKQIQAEFGILPNFISTETGTLPDSTGAVADTTKGAYFTEDGLFQIVLWDGDQWQDVGVSIPNSDGLPFVNVKWFGAVGDGVSDDSQPFIDALNASDCVIVEKTDSFYLIDERIILSSGKKVLGYGRPFLKLKGKDWGNTNANPAAIFVFPSDCVGAVVDGFELDGNKGNHTANNLLNIEVIECDGVSNYVSNNIIHNAESDGIDSDGSVAIPYVQGNFFINNTIYDCGGWGIHNSIGSNGNIVVGNEIYNCGFDKSRGGVDSFFGDSTSRSFGNHVFASNRVYSNRQNFDIRGDNESSFVGNIYFNESVASNFSKIKELQRSANIRDERASGTAPGNTAIGVWQQASLQTIDQEGDQISISSNNINIGDGSARRFKLFAEASIYNNTSEPIKFRIRIGNVSRRDYSQTVTVQAGQTGTAFVESFRNLISGNTLSLDRNWDYLSNTDTPTNIPIGLPASDGEPEIYARVMVTGINRP